MIKSQFVSKNLALPEKGVEACLSLLDSGATLPFISRYRKEMTGSLDEMQIASIMEFGEKFEQISKRKASILKSIEEQGELEGGLRKEIETSWDLQELEDLYLPYKKKRKTRADAAREKGLEGLAKILMKQEERLLESRIPVFLNSEVESPQEALKGARDIIAEWINENIKARDIVRRHFKRGALIASKLIKGKEEVGHKYRDYFDWSEKLAKAPSHRILAMFRGESEGFLKLSIAPDETRALEELNRFYVRGFLEVSEQVELAVADAYKRLLRPSIENEYRALSKEKADDESIGVFAKNLEQLLMLPPLGEKRILAIDPGFRTGCKLVCLDNHGALKHNETIFPHPPQNKSTEAMKKISQLVDAYNIEAIAVGNGTAGRETEQLIKRMHFPREVQVFVVNEAGASVYSASKVAREEFPNYDVTVRGSVSIGRRLMDPLAELVKIDPKSIGVGQYQHDVNQKKLEERLGQVVEKVVNRVGVDLNTASKHLLSHVAGLGPQLAQNIVDYRAESGKFLSRQELKKVARMGGKSFEQCAGFLRIGEGKNILDNTGVHPESYKLVELMAKDQKCSVQELVSEDKLRAGIDLNNYVSNEVGLPTLKDVLKELEKPGRDPREKIKIFEFDSRIKYFEDLEIGMILPGVISNVTNFGAFVDLGIKEGGLVHVSEIANAFVRDPNEFVSLNQEVKVKIVSLDKERKRIGLSMKQVEV